MPIKIYCYSDSCVSRIGQKLGARIEKTKDRLLEGWQCMDCSSAVFFERHNMCRICNYEIGKSNRCKNCKTPRSVNL